jgi:hypothetical protein
MSFSIWQAQDVPHSFELEQVWVHVDDVPHTVRHLLGLWVVSSLIGTTLDVDLVFLQSLGVVQILVAMMDPKYLDKFNEARECACLEVMATIKMKGYDLFFHHEKPDFLPDPGFTPSSRRKKVMTLVRKAWDRIMMIQMRLAVILPLRLLAWILITRIPQIVCRMARLFWEAQGMVLLVVGFLLLRSLLLILIP